MMSQRMSIHSYGKHTVAIKNETNVNVNALEITKS